MSIGGNYESQRAWMAMCKGYANGRTFALEEAAKIAREYTDPAGEIIAKKIEKLIIHEDQPAQISTDPAPTLE